MSDVQRAVGEGRLFKAYGVEVQLPDREVTHEEMVTLCRAAGLVAFIKDGDLVVDPPLDRATPVSDQIDQPPIVDLVKEMDSAKGTDKVVHVKRFMGGMKTPNEFWREFVLGDMRCFRCGAPPAFRVNIYLPLDEVIKRPHIAAALDLAKMVTGHVPVVERGKSRTLCVVWNRFCSCSGCEKECERSMAKAFKRASWVEIEFEKGPDPTNRVVVGYRS